VQPAPAPRDLALAPWEPHTLAAGLTLRATRRGHLLERSGHPPFAWIDDLAATRLAPQALTAAGALAMGRERDAPGRFVVLDRAGALLVSITPRRQWREVDVEPASGTPLNLGTLVVESGWAARDAAGRTVLRVLSRSGAAARMTLIGDARASLELPTVLAVAYAVLLCDELLAGAPGPAPQSG
jgi:hypothetical protein